MKLIEKVLVANRGEIAIRVMATCKRMGIATVAVFSDADRDALFVRRADQAVRLGPAPSAQSYLNIEAVLRAARLTGADAVHPGYGFLAENPDFAEACQKANLTFIGPTPRAIREMGLKREAKALVAKRGVPLLPGFDGGDQSTALLKKKAQEIGLPVIFKPSAGGGGKGMRIVRSLDELDAAIESGRREAQNAFGDPTLIIEKYLERPRHIEVQVLGDQHGNLVHLFERECSIQRRHQKVVEETPSVALTAEKRAAIGKAALEAAAAVGYTNAGTVEFIMDQDGRFYFSEMNTRLQVEHRVTELVTGKDLVELQLRVARGERLPFKQDELVQRGHAVQCRLYAEDATKGFMPAVGTIADWQLPDVGGLLVDTGVETGSEVSVHYDPMVAKLVTWGEDRADATRRMVQALERLCVQGVTTNRSFLTRLLRHPEYLAGRIHTQFIAEAMSEALADPLDAEADRLAAVAVTLWSHQQRSLHAVLPGIPSGYRNNRFADAFAEYTLAGADVRVEYRALGQGRFLVRALGEEGEYRVAGWDAPVLVLDTPSGVRHRVRVVERDGVVYTQSSRGARSLVEKPRFPVPGDESLKGGFMAPMPGKVIKVLVKDDEPVKKGQVLLVLEAMKMEQTTTASEDGVVQSVLVREGEQVTAGQVLVVMAEKEA